MREGPYVPCLGGAASQITELEKRRPATSLAFVLGVETSAFITLQAGFSEVLASF